MPDLSTLGGLFLMLLLIVVLLWFALGTQGNIKKGNAFLHWLQDGLPSLGPRTTLRWLGSSVVELKMERPRQPFRHAEVLVVLQARDVPLFWAWGWMRGRRDFLILRGDFPRPPGYEVEVGNARGWTGSGAMARVDPERWHREEWGVDGLEVAYTAGADMRTLRRAWEDLASLTGTVWRLSVRRETPHLEVHVPLTNTDDLSADRVVTAFRELGEVIDAR